MPAIAPALVPDMTSNDSPASSNACNTPKWAMPFAPPPANAMPTEMPRNALTRRSSPWRSCRVNAPPVDSTATLTSAFLNSQPLSSGATGVSASSNQTMRTFCASSPCSEFNEPRSWLTFAASRGSSSHSTSSHPSSCLKSVRPLEPGDQTTICRSTSGAGGCNSGVSLAASS